MRQQLHNITRKKLTTLRRAELNRRRRKKRARKRAAFLANPLKLIKQLLGQKCNSQLTCPKAEIDRHLRDTFSDEARKQDLGHCKSLINPPASSSSPGTSGGPYKVYKNCPRLLDSLWRRGKVAQLCRRGVDSRGRRFKKH